jgi:hypothetical protein
VAAARFAATPHATDVRLDEQARTWKYRRHERPPHRPYCSVRLADVDTLAQVDPGNPDVTDCAFHLVRRHFDVQAFGVNAATGNAGDEMIEEHHEADDEENQTNGHEELFAVMTGHAIFTSMARRSTRRPARSSSCVTRCCFATPGRPPTARRS